MTRSIIIFILEIDINIVMHLKYNNNMFITQTAVWLLNLLKLLLN